MADLLSYTEAKHLVDGFPKNLEFYQKSRSTSRMRKSWPKKKKKAEADLMVRRSIDRFGWNFIANNSYEVQGACAEWGFLEITYERGESYIRLNDLGRKFVSFENDVIKNMVKFTVGEQEGGTDLLNNSSGLDTLPNDWITTAINFDFSEKEVEFLMKNVFRKYPLEVDAMKMMLGIGSFGNEEVSGAEILKNEFWKLQEDYLKETEPKMLEEQMAKKIEENIFLRKDKFNPKTRALSVMSRLREMGLFKKDGKTIYNITERGRHKKDNLE